MSNNNRSSNRRRGRGGNRSQGGGNQGNRIDSRARGNAPQLLEKYRKLAHDASLNGDRVQAEYYLQFADHYFRVLADSRAQREDQRPRHERDPQDGYDDDFDDDRGQNRGQPQQQRNNRDRYDPDDRDSEGRDSEGRDSEGRGSDERDSDEYESSENPFTREERAPREERGAREDRGSREERSNREERGRSRRNRNEAPRGGDEGEAGFDASILPPAIGKGEDEDEAAPRPRKPRRTKSRGSDEESLETVE